MKRIILWILVMNLLLLRVTSLEQTDLDKFLMIAKEFSEEHTYDPTTYNCVDYTDDLYDLVKSLDITIKKIRGCPPLESKDSTCHRFLRLVLDGSELDFEPIYAEFRDYSKEYPDQTEVIW